MDVDAQRGQHQSGQPAHGEEGHEAQGVEHRGLESDRRLVKRGRPIEDLDRRGHGHQERQAGKDQRRVHRYSGHEHVVRQTKNPRQAMPMLE